MLKTFSKSEISKFRDFVNSPYFNKNANIIKLNELILDYYPGFDAKEFTEENIFKKIFGKEKYNYFKIKNLISDLYQITLTYLVIIANNKKKIENEICLLNELHERKLDNLFVAKEKQINRELNSRIKDEFYYLNQYQLSLANTSHFKFKKSGYSFNLIQNEFDSFLRYSIIGLLRHYSKMLTNKNHGNIQFNLEMFDDFWKYIKDKNFEDSPSCQIYKQIIAIELYREEKDYKKLVKFKEKYSDKLSDEDIYYTLLVMNSFAAYRLKLGDESYYRDRFRVFKELTDRNLNMRDYILFVNFISSYTSACMVGEYKWAEEFMDQYRDGISPPDEKENSINYCRAFLSYRLKEYDKALEFFSKTSFKLFIMKVMVKSYTLRIFYEKKMYEQIFSAIDAFRHYLKSEKQIGEEQKDAHYEFLKHLTELTKLKLENIKDNNNTDLNFLRMQIKEMSSNPLGAKNWLIEKAEKFNV